MVEAQPGQATRLRQTAVLGAVGLEDVDGPAFDPGNKALAASQDFAPGNRDRRDAGQLDVPLDVIGKQRFSNQVILKSPALAVSRAQLVPCGQNCSYPRRRPSVQRRRQLFPSGADDHLVEGPVAASKGAPAHFDRLEPAGHDISSIRFSGSGSSNRIDP